MRIVIEPQDIDFIAQRLVDLLKTVLAAKKGKADVGRLPRFSKSDIDRSLISYISRSF